MPIFIGETPLLTKPKELPVAQTPSDRIVREIEQFLFREARLLDEERLAEWLGLMTADIHYWMPGIQARYRNDRKPAIDPNRMAHYDEDMLALRRRVTRFKHETAWAEDPPTRTVRIISGIEVELTNTTDELLVHSTFANCRGRNESDEDILYGRRKDILRRIAGSWKLARREIHITQAVLKAKNLNVFL